MIKHLFNSYDVETQLRKAGLKNYLGGFYTNEDIGGRSTRKVVMLGLTIAISDYRDLKANDVFIEFNEKAKKAGVKFEYVPNARGHLKVLHIKVPDKKESNGIKILRFKV